MLDPELFLAEARRAGFSLLTGVPCSFLTPLLERASASGPLRYVPAANEGDAVAIASGAELGGRRAITFLQNSGLGNAVNPLTSLNATFAIPTLLLVTLRGDAEGARGA